MPTFCKENLSPVSSQPGWFCHTHQNFSTTGVSTLLQDGSFSNLFLFSFGFFFKVFPFTLKVSPSQRGTEVAGDRAGANPRRSRWQHTPGEGHARHPTPSQEKYPSKMVARAPSSTYGQTSWRGGREGGRCRQQPEPAGASSASPGHSVHA